MDVDPEHSASLVTRQVRTGERDGGATRSVVARRRFDRGRGALWQAITDQERLSGWFLPVTGDLHAGGRYQLEGNAGGTIEACDAPRRLAVTWEFGEQVSWLDVTLEPDQAATLLELLHEAPLDPGFWTEFGPGAAGVGWDLALLGLGLHLDSGESVDPAEAEAWTLSPAGVAFVRSAAAAWADAAIADGDEVPAARAAADRTVGFYTTPPQG